MKPTETADYDFESLIKGGCAYAALFGKMLCAGVRAEQMSARGYVG